MKRIVTITSLIAVLAIVGLTSPVPAEMAASGTTSPVRDAVATQEEARVVAENWMTLVVERDGDWAGSTSPSIGEFSELRRGDLLLGYYASVEPRGYMVISPQKDYSPIKAYSTTSNLDPDAEGGMSALLGDVLETRAKFLIDRFGGLDEASLQGLHELTRDTTRLAWSHLLEGGPALRTNLQSLHPETDGASSGEWLLKTSWHQSPPYNDDCPYKGEDCRPWDFNHNAVVGCVPLAMAQIMRYWAWPPFWQEQYYDWPDMLNEYVWDNISWFNDEHGNPVTQDQIDAVADLCRDAGRGLHPNITYTCNRTGAFVCQSLKQDARDAFEDHFLYSDPGADPEEPNCEWRHSHSGDWWWDKITEQILVYNSPMMLGIAGGTLAHAAVIDGYDGSGQLIHVNYGWADAHNAWYHMDELDCDKGPGYLKCTKDETHLVRWIYPRDGLCGNLYGEGPLDPWGGATTRPHYVYCDANAGSDGLTVQGGARVQFLPGTKLLSDSGDGQINIYGAAPDNTRFFSDGLATRGLQVKTDGHVKVEPGGEIVVH